MHEKKVSIKRRHSIAALKPNGRKPQNSGLRRVRNLSDEETITLGLDAFLQF